MSITQELKRQEELIYLAPDITSVYLETGYAMGVIAVARSHALMTKQACNSWSDKIIKARDKRIRELYT